MGKKTIVVLLVGLVLASVHSADAQQPKKLPKIGFLSSGGEGVPLGVSRSRASSENLAISKVRT